MVYAAFGCTLEHLSILFTICAWLVLLYCICSQVFWVCIRAAHRANHTYMFLVIGRQSILLKEPPYIYSLHFIISAPHETFLVLRRPKSNWDLTASNRIVSTLWRCLCNVFVLYRINIYVYNIIFTYLCFCRYQSGEQWFSLKLKIMGYCICVCLWMRFCTISMIKKKDLMHLSVIGFIAHVEQVKCLSYDFR